MFQILSNLKTGEITLAEAPAPSMGSGELLIRTRRSLVSQGTERMLVEFGRASLLKRARSQPEKVRQVLAKIRTEGLIPTLGAIVRRLDEPLPLGYCNVGEVLAVGAEVRGFRIGERVASNGPHAEIVAVPANLTAKIPENVTDDEAAFTVVGAIGLQSLRLAKPEFGETFVVIGLGLIGQIVAQLLTAAGCRVIGFDFDASKVQLAQTLGITAAVVGGDSDPVARVLSETDGNGADGVIITASTASNEVIAQSAQLSRKRGRIILVGVVGLQLDRADFYQKELTFQVSCSYGPGRYDDSYEEKGFDYPLPYVRWTENRNFQAVLQSMAVGSIDVKPLITRRVSLNQFQEIYGNMSQGGLASLLTYGETSSASPTLDISGIKFEAGAGSLAIVGSGNFTKMTVLPALRVTKSRVKQIVSANGITGTALARKYHIPISTTDYAAVLSDPEIGGVIITTRHNLHAEQSLAAIAAEKHVMVEKPLCLKWRDLIRIERAIASLPTKGPTLTVGYNRRFSPFGIKMKELVRALGGPTTLVATINVGSIPANHWVHDPEIGGGRLIGEACHFVDFAIFISGSLISEVTAVALNGTSDSASFSLKHANGSISTINYLSQGNSAVSKERIEVHVKSKSLLLENFRDLRGFGFKSFNRLKGRQDKGHTHQFALFAERVKNGGPPLIPWVEVANSTRATLALRRALVEKRSVSVDEDSN